MNLTNQRRIAATLLKCGKSRVWFDESRLADIKEAITKTDIRRLIKEDAIKRSPMQGISGFRSRHRAKQKRKGRQRGQGSRKGRKNARLPSKDMWIARVRVQRSFLKNLRQKKMLESLTYRKLYRKSKGGFFRSKRHMELYMEEHGIGKQAATKSRAKGAEMKMDKGESE